MAFRLLELLVSGLVAIAVASVASSCQCEPCVAGRNRAVIVDLSDTSGAPIGDADITCAVASGRPAAAVSPSPGRYECVQETPGIFDVRVTWRGSQRASATVEVETAPDSIGGGCHFPATAHLAFMLEPVPLDAGTSADATGD